MSNVLQSIVDRLVSQLPDSLSYLTPDDLIAAGWPEFLVARIRVELEQNMAESVSLPESDWANMHAETVQDAWRQFLEAIRAETRLPVSYVRPVLETSLEDVVDLLSQPLTSLPDYLFGSLSELSRDHLALRISKTGVYPSLTHALVRYLDRKQLDTLSKVDAARILHAVDAKLSESYTALNWGQVLAPLFELMPDGVEPELLAAYFRERGMTSEARAFASIDRLVDTSKLIELLSQPFEDVEDEEPEIVASPVAPPIEVLPEPELEAEAESEPEQEPEPTAIPIWQRFIPQENDEETIGNEPTEKVNVNEPASMLSFYNQDPSEDPRASRILELMAGAQEECIERIFGGDEGSFYAAISDIARYETYAEAGRYIKKEIFDRNRVDLFSDDAVLFLDRVQTYFLETP
jgi:hypothetical protein